MTNPLLQLRSFGQSVWLDDIDRGQLRSGLFRRPVDEDGLAGATGNPTIFEHSIIHDTIYDEQMRQLQEEGVQKLIDSFQKLFQYIESKQRVLRQ